MWRGNVQARTCYLQSRRSLSSNSDYSMDQTLGLYNVIMLITLLSYVLTINRSCWCDILYRIRPSCDYTPGGTNQASVGRQVLSLLIRWCVSSGYVGVRASRVRLSLIYPIPIAPSGTGLLDIMDTSSDSTENPDRIRKYSGLVCCYYITFLPWPIAILWGSLLISISRR